MPRVDILKLRGDRVLINGEPLADYLERRFQEAASTPAAWPYRHQLLFDPDEARASLSADGAFPIFDSAGMRHAGHSNPADVGLSLVTVQRSGRLFVWTFACPVDHRLLMESPGDLSLCFDRQNLEDELGVG